MVEMMKREVKILFLHGLESSPGGSKPKYLESMGYTVMNPHMPPGSYEEACNIAQRLIDDTKPDIVVGSSRGGAIAMNNNLASAKLVLIAPAWRKYGVPTSKYQDSDTIVLHCMGDEVVPYSDSVELADNWGVSLHECGQSHRMNSTASLAALLNAVRYHVNRITESEQGEAS